MSAVAERLLESSSATWVLGRIEVSTMASFMSIDLADSHVNRSEQFVVHQRGNTIGTIKTMLLYNHSYR